MVAITRGTTASETFAPSAQAGGNPFGPDVSLTYGNGGDDRFFVVGTSDKFNFADIVAGGGNDSVDVRFGAGNYLAGGGNDTLNLHTGNYNYDGDAGTDTLVLDGAVSSYTVFPAGNGTTFFSNNLSVQTANVETFRFAGLTVNQADGNLLVDDLFYLSRYPDVAAAGVDPEVHFAQFGRAEGRNPNLFFDTNGYLAAYPDVAAAGVDPLQHYNTIGYKEGRDPSLLFDTRAYLAANPDVAAAGINPLQHYLEFGVVEARPFVSDGAFFA